MRIRLLPQASSLGLLLFTSALFAVACIDVDQDDVTAVQSTEALTQSPVNAEAESLTRVASAIGSKVTWESAASGGRYVEFNGTAAPGAWIEFTLPSVAAGTYDLKFLFKSNANRGIVQASVDGVSQGSPCNEYSAAAAYKVPCTLGQKTLAAGTHRIRFTVVGKSASSTGHQMVVDQVSLSTAACSTTSACPAGQVCLGGVCQASATCDSSTACAAGQVCIGGLCQASASCGSSAACAAGQVCIGGFCQTQTR